MLALVRSEFGLEQGSVDGLTLGVDHLHVVDEPLQRFALLPV